jgi:hypothetical protein
MAALPTSLPDPALSTVQLEAIAALATGQTILAAAGQTGVHRATVHNWLKLPAFSAALDQACQDHAAEISARLSQVASLAIDTIRQILTDPNASPAVKLRAAIAVLDRPLFPKSAAAPSQETSPKAVAKTAPATDTARNAPCPCGSGVKYKRCCGTQAPPKLGFVSQLPRAAGYC